MQIKKKYFAFALAAVSSMASAVPGDVETSWGDSGHVISMADIWTFPSALLVDTVAAPDGGFFQVASVKLNGGGGETLVQMFRFDKQGVPVGAFGGIGQSGILQPGHSLYPGEAVVQPDGKLIVVGAMVVNGSDNMDMFVCRVLPDGTPDFTFAASSEVPGCATELPGNDVIPGGLDLANAVALKPDGKILVAGTIDGTGGLDAIAVTQLLPTGDVDETFGNAGRQKKGLALFRRSDRDIAGTDVGLTSAGKIVVAGRWSLDAVCHEEHRHGRRAVQCKR